MTTTTNDGLPGGSVNALHAEALSPASTMAPASAVSWGAILAGAAGAAALSLILLLLGTGLGLSSASPWASQGASAATLGIAGIFWITFTQLAASGMGGYLAGRLRTRWASLHGDEVYFRDTAHGFLAWAVASLATAAFLASAVGSIVGAGAQAGASLAGGVATAGVAAGAGAASATRPGTASGTTGSSTDANGYFVDTLFRPDMNAPAAQPPADGAMPGGSGVSLQVPPPAAAMPMGQAAAAPTPAITSAEVSRIMASGLRAGSLPQDDVRYVGRLVSQRTGLSQQDAEKRVTDTFAKAQAKLRDAEATAKDAADKARKASAATALWLFISLLIGAFVASFAATFGGRQRDRF